MNVVCEDAQVVVLDDVLPHAEFEAFWNMFRNARFRGIHDEGVHGVFRVSDGEPYIGERVAWMPGDVAALLPPGTPVESVPIRFYPTGKPYDLILDVVRRASSDYPHIFGRAGADWVGVLASLYAFPSGTGLSWHTDAVDFSGAFIFYAHPHWDVQWGGELFVADPSTRYERIRDAAHDFDNRHESEVLLRRGIGRYIMPKPNRLVLLAPGNPHKIAKVAPGAGDHVRASFSGLFIAPSAAERFVREWQQGAFRARP